VSSSGSGFSTPTELTGSHRRPLWPGDQISHLSDTLAQFNVAHVPKGKKFYLYSVEKRKYDIAGDVPKSHEGVDGDKPYENTYLCFIESCRYPDPDPPHDFLFSIIEELDGWFLASDEGNDEMIRLFGLAPEEVARGTMSLVVLTDARGIIVDLHPRKTLSDALTIVSQHPELADVQRWYRN